MQGNKKAEPAKSTSKEATDSSSSSEEKETVLLFIVQSSLEMAIRVPTLYIVSIKNRQYFNRKPLPDPDNSQKMTIEFKYLCSQNPVKIWYQIHPQTSTQSKYLKTFDQTEIRYPRPDIDS
jgi:hypothetical protein